MDTDLKNKVAVFKARASTFHDQLMALKANKAKVPPAWLPQYERLLARGESIKQEAIAAGATIDSGYRLARGGLGLTDEQINLGILPLVPLAIVSGAGALMSYYANDAYTFNAKVDELERLQELGYTREEAAVMLEKPQSGGAMGTVRKLWDIKPVRYAGLGIAGWLLIKRVVKPKLLG